MAGMIKSSIHHFDGFVGLAGNGGGSGKDGGGAAICGALLVSAGIGTVETIRCDGLGGLLRRDWRCRGRAVAGVRAGHDWRRRLPGPLQQALGAARAALIPFITQKRLLQDKRTISACVGMSQTCPGAEITRGSLVG